MTSPPDIQENTPFAVNLEHMDEEVLTTLRDGRLALLNGVRQVYRVLRGWVCAVLLIAVATCSSSALIVYAICYFGRDDHFLQFVSHFCYWPTVMSVQIILVVALWIQQITEDVTEISWANVFRLSHEQITRTSEVQRSFCSRFNRVCTMIIYLGLPAGHAALKIIYSTKLHPECRNKTQWLWIVVEIVGVFFFSFFCFFLLTKRKELQKFRRESKTYIRDHKGEIDLCIQRARNLFQEYYQLQTFLVPWLYLTVLCSMFGIGVCITWNYNKVKVSGTNMPSYQENEIKFCTYACDSRDFMREGSVLLLYNSWVFWRHLVTLILPCFSARGLDVSFVWDNFKIDLSSLYSADNIEFSNNLRKFVDDLHPKRSSNKTINFLLGTCALAAGILSGQTSNF